MPTKDRVRSPFRTPSLAKTARGFAGRFGGRWGTVPQPPQWYTTSVQVCGVYPYSAGSARPTDGAPLGRDRRVGTAVCTDHESLYRAGVISSPSMMLFGINGVGKSSTAQTILLGQAARGITLGVHNPIKAGEHTALIRALGGPVWEVGPSASNHKINLLAPGPLGEAARRIGGDTGRELEHLARDKAIQLTQLIARTTRGEPLHDIEDAVLEALVDDARTRNARPATAHLLEAFSSPSERVLGIAGYNDAGAFYERHRRLGETLRAMLSGEMGRMLGGDADTVQYDPGNPGGWCFDTSAIPESNTKLLSAAMLSSWSLGMDIIDAHWELAKHERQLAERAAREGELYTPKVTWRGYSTLMDEFWYPIRACEGIVDRVDRLSRTNRSIGSADMKVTHSPKDMLSLPNPADREKARGLAERAGLLGLMALTREDLEMLSRVRSLTEKEIDTVAGFNSSPSWSKPKAPRGARRDAAAKPPAPPGAGLILLKVPERVGIEVQMLQTSVQANLHVTDTRYREQD
ncbi:ATP-binding protein [Agromyces neolithicus]|uniref:ATP-binding protein n=1 Tax=Agromyces neolithicus TaxID=269420 RepID=A0ABP4YQN0_9MICO